MQETSRIPFTASDVHATYSNSLWENAVLIVDDDQDILKWIYESVSGITKNVYQAESGEKALEILRSRSIDVLVTDMKMPGIDGLELAELVQEESLAESTIIVTGFGNRMEIKRALNRGGIVYILDKPFEVEELSEVLSWQLMATNQKKMWKAAESLIDRYLGGSSSPNSMKERAQKIEAMSMNLNQDEAKLNPYSGKDEEADNNPEKSLVTRISQELRSPLNLVLGYAELILESLEDKQIEKIRNDVEKILHSGIQLLHFVNQLLDIKKSELRQIKLHPKLLDLAGLAWSLNCVLKANMAEFEDKVHVTSSTKRNFYGDEIRVKQAIISSIRSLIGITRSASINVFMNVALGNKQPHLKVDIIGYGLQTSTKILNKAFSLTNIGQSSLPSLDTAMFKPIVEAMGGTAKVIGDSSRTIIELQIPESQQQRAPDQDTIAKVLIVDDDSDTREMIGDLLAEMGPIDISYAEDGLHALEQITQEAFDLVILDYLMPSLNGAQLLHRLKEKSIFPPTIVCSGVDDVASRAFKNLSPQKFIGKPFETTEMQQAVVDLAHLQKKVVI